MKLNNIKSGAALMACLVPLIFNSSCDSSNKKKQPVVENQTPAPPRVKAPDFSSDTAFEYVKKQVEFGPRVPNTQAHRLCGDFLVNELKRFAHNVIEQKAPAKTFDGTNLMIRNIIAEFNPENPKRIILCSHWDTRPFADQDTVNTNKPISGANDGASGVGVLLEMARLFHDKNPGIGIDIIFFDAEDWGSRNPRDADSYCLGSQHWSKNPHKPGYSAKYGILLDMVGGRNAKFAQEGISLQFAPDVVQKVWSTGQNIGYGNYFINYTRSGITDDHYYMNDIAKIPTIDIIQYDINTESGFGEYWHTHRDNLEAVDPATLKAVGQTLLEVVYNEK